MQFVKIEIEPTARIADDDYGLRFHAPPSHRPEILVIVERGTVTDRATIEFPGGRGGDNDEHNNDGHPAPRHLGDRPLVIARNDFAWLGEEQTRQPKFAFKIGSR
ncbi:MAG: hypothetical protein DMF25_11690 [Verrucomicrobia bacterium]|nr:MAG: hypothetical protein DMF25_11690 [Verrucomicrobiota bacterium]